MVMAYDRYVAVCDPLHYSTIMSNRHLIKLYILCWIGAFIFFSYIKIIISVIKVASSERRKKAFSTCASHLLVILVFYLVAVFVFITYRIQGFSDDVRIMAAVLQNVIPPLVNPIIYCLKTRDIRKSFLKFIRKQVSVEALLTGF
ncbi:olfactory receptor 6M1-like [Lepisosteus oculatus]|uniref:olfactory receptor 6M1-like n=1 Tax=Lepisosteus oculatus TaxID=7918 RepID=UPI003710889A